MKQVTPEEEIILKELGYNGPTTYLDVWLWLWNEKNYCLEPCEFTSVELVIGYGIFDSSPSIIQKRKDKRTNVEEIISDAISNILKDKEFIKKYLNYGML